MSVQVTNNDIVLLGHGSYPGGATNTRLPDNIDLYILQPVGYTLMTDVAAALINQSLIPKIKLNHDNGSGSKLIDPPMAVYKGGDNAPNLTLYDLGSLADWGRRTIGDKQNVVTVNRPTMLADIIKTNSKIIEALKRLPKGGKLKLYWSACASQVSGNSASMP